MRRRLAVACLGALALAAADLLTKRLVPTEPRFFDQRSNGWITLSIAVVCGSALLALLPSRAVTFASAVLGGGALGNLVSAEEHGRRVANPFVLSGSGGGIAFNLADVFVMAGILLQTAALIAVTIRYRRVLPQSTVGVRLSRRLLARRRRVE
jgi:hypothetical protein